MCTRPRVSSVLVYSGDCPVFGCCERSGVTADVTNGVEIIHVAARPSASQEAIRSSLSKEFLALIAQLEEHYVARNCEHIFLYNIR
jgi:hypothetical protein